MSDWKHGVLSNGATVGPFTGLMTFVWWAPLIACAEIGTGFLSSYAMRGTGRMVAAYVTDRSIPRRALCV